MEAKHQFDVESYNRTVDEAVEGHRSMPPHMAERFRKFLESLEAFDEKEGLQVPKHSHRFAPENLWPNQSKDAKPEAGES